MKRKNPFRGIAHSNGSSYNQSYFRHIEGARDTRPAWPRRCREELLDFAITGTTPVHPFRDINPVPAGFCE